MFWPNFIAATTFWSVALAGGFYWGRRYVRALEARAGADARIAVLEDRLRAIEEGRITDRALPASPARLQAAERGRGD